MGDETKRYEYDLSQGFSTFDTQSDFDYNSDFSTNSKYSRIYPQTPFQQADMSYEKGRSYSGQDEMIARYKQMREHDMRNLKEQNDKVFKQMEEEFKQNYGNPLNHL